MARSVVFGELGSSVGTSAMIARRRDFTRNPPEDAFSAPFSEALADDGCHPLSAAISTNAKSNVREPAMPERKMPVGFPRRLQEPLRIMARHANLWREE
jgi:hypothetical protein